MKKEKKNSMDNLHFLYENDKRPVAILEPDGAVYNVNDHFREYFNIKELVNIKNLKSISSNNWEKYLKLANKNGYKEFKAGIQLHSDEETFYVKVHLSSCNSTGKIVVLFNLPPSISCKNDLGSLKMFRKSDNLMIVFNRSGIILDVNELTYEFLNSSRENFIGKHIRELFPLFSVSTSHCEKYVQKVISIGREETLLRFDKTPDDSRYYKVTTFLDEETNMFITRLADQTEKVLLRKRLEHKETLSEVGKLAASIAHEIRNPITTLKGFTQLLRNSSAEESMKYLTVIEDEIDRMEEILSEMLFMSKPKVEAKELVPINRLVSDMINIVYPKAHIEGISIIQKECDVDASIYGNEAKLKQVLLNLFKNALEAMTPGGKLTIEVKVADKVELSITDTGKGMTDTQLNQIFMPYFTTRSEGTGLGLPFVIKTVEENGGTVSVASDFGIGTKFTLSFPIASQNVIMEEKELSQSGSN